MLILHKLRACLRDPAFEPAAAWYLPIFVLWFWRAAPKPKHRNQKAACG
jgi:hypothetical protein